MTQDEVTEGMLEGMVGFLIGYLIGVSILYLIEEWVVASEVAERGRIRSIIWEMLEEERTKKEQECKSS